MRYEDDNPIDWSPFDEADTRSCARVPGAQALKIMSILLMLVAVVGLIYGIVQLRALLSSDALADGGVVYCITVLGVALLTLIPGAFGLQTAGGSSPTTCIVFGIIGILLPLISPLVSFVAGVRALQWFILEVPAVPYLVFALRVKRGRDAAQRTSGVRRSRKDELWDEDKIWG